MKKLTIIKTGKEACRICKGACCRGTPGESLPKKWLKEDGRLDKEKVKRALASGLWSIDIWDAGNPKTGKLRGGEVSWPILKPARIGKGVGGVYDFRLSFDSTPCVFLTESGCRLEDTQRPEGCSELVSRISIFEKEITRHCAYPNDVSFRRRAAIEWMDHAEELFEIGNIVESYMESERSEPCYFGS